ncbi:CoF synthetase [Bradyrhizobium sp. WYCCWR 13023]|uniref:CoF synthetase n=1 Tax=Bradyrhizobium zhengyangense TaxID=2911009 RepID=A0A9X1RG29_9BRAD|nr:F390 synthetase-related protein [Bradyrhizobium zhengyangense]MCG2631301.1 CoF synthetase [Bradyrhizobium zhengyangense]MCG2644201.1 CoF synthetase [Bradyrhizobium zhengyangense]MCG2669884.1 CoF synthetase [Bradyrhizobium zhengyangense]
MSRLALASAYLRTRLLRRWLTSRNRIERWQQPRLARLMHDATRQVAFYRGFRDKDLSALPLVDKREVMARFQDFNRLGLMAAQIWSMIDRGEAPKGYDVGCSTGTSGNQGLYLVSDQERFVWLGTLVAKAIPLSLLRQHRVAVVLPRSSRLYDAANESKLLKLRFVDLRLGLQSAAETLAAFKPDVVVAPPKALRWFAENDVAIAPRTMFSSAEVLDPPDREVIERRFGLNLRQIYMATEGLFGVSCERGTLHLAEDVVHFEFEPVAGSPDLVVPVVTDFTRRTQIMARYRMNDILRLDSRRCPCGSALQAVAEVIGRRDDVFVLPNRDAARPDVMVTPDVLRNAVLAADRSIDDFRIRQTGENRIDIVLPLHVGVSATEGVRTAVLVACTQLEARPVVEMQHEALQPRNDAKLRRVENCWKPSAA